MKKLAIAMALALGMGAGGASAVDMNSATFTMLDGTGATVGVDPTVTGSIGGGAWAVASTTTFFWCDLDDPRWYNIWSWYLQLRHN